MTFKVVERISLITGATVFILFFGIAIAPFLMQAKTENAPNVKPVKSSIVTQDLDSETLIKDLNLTEKQKQEIRRIRHNRAVAISKLLTPDQRTKFKQSRMSKKSMLQIINELNLNPDQKKQTIAIAHKSANEIKSKLTKAQLNILSDYMRKHSGRVAPIE